MKINIFYIIFILLFSGCDSKIVTEPSKILPILKAAQRCCDGNQCKGAYDNISKSAACTDVRQFEKCLEGQEDECPSKGYGAF